MKRRWQYFNDASRGRFICLKGQMLSVLTKQQLGHLALKGVDLEDRRAGNIMHNQMTGRPTQLDYGDCSSYSLKVTETSQQH